MSSGVLTLIPTPLNPEHPIHSSNLEIIKESLDCNSLILIEDAKATRKRWTTSWGLDRCHISSLIEFNEHTQDSLLSEVLNKLKSGANVLLLSDEGLPAFCDPGTELVNQCHQRNIKVTAGIFENSLILALALSGFDSRSFIFSGFPPRDKEKRKLFFNRFVSEKKCAALMDTAYRLERVLSEIDELDPNGIYCVASELNRPGELVLRGKPKVLRKSFAGSKKDFILVKSPCDRNFKKKK